MAGRRQRRLLEPLGERVDAPSLCAAGGKCHLVAPAGPHAAGWLARHSRRRCICAPGSLHRYQTDSRVVPIGAIVSATHTRADPYLPVCVCVSAAGRRHRPAWLALNSSALAGLECARLHMGARPHCDNNNTSCRPAPASRWVRQDRQRVGRPASNTPDANLFASARARHTSPLGTALGAIRRLNGHPRLAICSSSPSSTAPPCPACRQPGWRPMRAIALWRG